VTPSSVVLTALKPAGNPLAAGTIAGETDSVTVRVYETAGQPALAEVSLAAGIREARTASVLEAPRAALTGAAASLGPSGIATIVAATGTPISLAPGRGARVP
jgi:alpha-mannosidase